MVKNLPANVGGHEMGVQSLGWEDPLEVDLATHSSTVACQSLLSMEFSRQEFWIELPFPILEGLPNPEIKPVSLASSKLLFFRGLLESHSLQPHGV